MREKRVLNLFGVCFLASKAFCLLSFSSQHRMSEATGHAHAFESVHIPLLWCTPVLSITLLSQVVLRDCVFVI